jgi:hypothetical protein
LEGGGVAGAGVDFRGVGDFVLREGEQREEGDGEEKPHGDWATGNSSLLEEVGAVGAGASEALSGAPFGDFAMVTAEEDIGDGQASEVGGFGVLRGFEEAGGTEGFFDGAEFVSEDAGEEADDGVDHDDCGDGAVGEDVVAEGEFFGLEVFDDAVVDAFVVAGDENEVGVGGEALSGGLIEAFAGGAGNDDATAGGEGFDGGEEGFGFEDHARAAAGGGVIDLAMFAEAVVTEVVDVEVEGALLLGAAHHAEAQGDADEIGEEGDDVDAHGVRALR